MAVYKRDIADINLETGNIHRTFLNHSIGLKDQQADHFGVRVFRDGEPVNLSGVSVQGVFMPPQGSPIAITSGNIVSGNVAEVVLPQACYNYDGQFCLAIKLVDATNSVTGTVRIVDGMVDNTHASGTVAPTSAVPTYQEVLSVYEQAIAAISTVNAMAGKMAVDITAGAEATSNNSFKDLGNRWMTFRRGYYSTPSAGSTSSYTDDVNYVYALVACAPGDVLHAHGYGDGTSKSAWAFLDSSLKILDRGGSGNYEGTTDPAPTSTAFALVNVKLASLGSGYYGWTGPEAIKDQIATLKDAVSEDGSIIYSRDLKSAIDQLIDIPGDNIVALTDFTDKGSVTTSIDTDNNTITVTASSGGKYRNVQTESTFVQNNLIPGKSYRLHAKAEKLSGSADIIVCMRGISGNADAISDANIQLGTGGEGFVDFIADSYMKRVTLFINMGSNASPSVKFSEIWLKEYNTTGLSQTETALTNDNTFIVTSFPMAIFRGESTITTNDNASDGNGAIIRRAQFSEPFEIGVDEGYHLTVMKNDGNSVRKYYNQTKMFFDAGQLFSIAFLKDDSTLVTLDDLAHLHLKCTQSLKDYLDAKYTYQFNSGSLIFYTPEETYDTPIARGGFSTSAKLIKRTPQYRRTTVEIVSHNGFIVMAGYYSTNNPGVIVHKINDDKTITSVTVANRTRAVFVAGHYILEYFNSNTSANTSINRYVYIESIETNGTPSGITSQLMTPGDQRGQGFMFDDDFNIWILKNQVQGENSKMYVRKQDNTYTDAISLGMDVGHGNNIIYFGGKVWISDWYQPNIYRFTIDSDEYTVTYVDTIEMPSTGITGSIEYVPISDNEIIGMTWSDASREVLDIVRYVKQRTTGNYVEQERFPVSVHDYILQGANYYDGYLYCLMDNSSNVNQGIQIINMKTHNSVFISSDYQTESESVMDIKYNELNNNVDVVIGYEQGTIYRLVFDKKFLPQ